MATSLGKVGIRNRGRFDASATYAAGEYVYYMGSTFIALQNLPAGMVPQHDGINWNFLAEGASVEQVLQNFAPIEDGATVSQAYSAGSYLLHEDILYKTMTDIASGGAIIIGTNITPVTIGEEMHSLAKNFANEEDSAVATMNYSVGQYLVYNEQFYKVTAAISAGQALVSGTNIEATNVGTQLSALNDSLTNFMSVRYQANNAATSYTFDAFHSFGVALVFTHYDVWAVYYDGSSARYSKLTSFKSTYNITSASFSNNKITITFDATAWAGIVVYQ